MTHTARGWTSIILLVTIFTLGAALSATAIEVRPVGETQPVVQPEAVPEKPAVPLKLQLSTDKAVYRVGEAIRFSVKGNKDYHLYVFGINEAANTAYLLLPNEYLPDNRFQAGKDYVLPEKFEYYGDRAGVEKVIFVASSKPIDLNTGRYAKAGPLMTADPEVIHKDLKAIRMRQTAEAEQDIRELKLSIVAPEPKPAAAPASKVAAFVSSDRTEYRLTEEMKITYGADAKGYIHLYSVEPDGRRILLTKHAIDGQRFYQVKAQAATPTGGHKLVAVYSPAEDLETASAAGAAAGGRKTKGIILVENKPLPFAVYHLNILD